MDVDSLIKVISPLIAVIFGVIVKNQTEKKSKLISYFGHASVAQVKQINSTVINAHNVIIRNAGKKTAFNVRITHQYLPDDMIVYPNSTAYSVNKYPNGGAEILLPSMVEDEQIIISYSYLPPLTFDKINSSIKSDDGFCQQISSIPEPPKSRLIISFQYFLMFFGMSLLVYLAASFAKSII